MKPNTRLFSLATAAAVVAGLTACAAPAPYTTTTYTTTTPVATVATVAPASVEFGRITNVSMIHTGTQASGANSAVGTVAGALVGGVLGSTIGGGTGRAVATILGAVGGAAVGNSLANRSYTNVAHPVHRVSVQTDQGYMREFDVSASADLRVGDRVRIENGVIYQG